MILMWDCIRCNSSNMDEDTFCIKCGTIKVNPNYCNNIECEAYKIILNNPHQKYCGKCGKPTMYAIGKSISASVEPRDLIKENGWEGFVDV